MTWKLSRKETKPKNRDRRISRNERVIRELCGQTTWNNIHIIGIPEEERDKGIESLFEEIIVANFPNVRKLINTQVMEAQRYYNKKNPRKTT